jgi:hypothetical protein
VTIGVALDVTLKGIDLVADTAFLTLRGKMGYGDKLMGIKRLDAYEFSFETGNPPETLSKLKRFLNTQSLFYNRNKHNFSLRCRWEGGGLDEGTPISHFHRQLVAQTRNSLGEARGEDFRSTGGESRVMFSNVPVFRTEVLVEDLDPSVKGSLARKLEVELSTAPVAVATLGISWHMALRAGTGEEARAVTEEIAVTEKRDRGLLLNPNYQGFRFLKAERMELGE